MLLEAEGRAPKAPTSVGFVLVVVFTWSPQPGQWSPISPLGLGWLPVSYPRETSNNASNVVLDPKLSDRTRGTNKTNATLTEIYELAAATVAVSEPEQ